MKLNDIIDSKKEISLIKIMKLKMAIIYSNGANQKIISRLSNIEISSLIHEGLPIVDFTNLSKRQVDTLAILLPIPSLLPDPAPYGPMSKSPVSIFIDLSRKIGADVYNLESIDFPSYLFKKDMMSEMKIFNMMINKEISIEKVREKTRLDKNLKEVQKKIMCQASQEDCLSIKRVYAVLRYYSSPLVEDFAWMCIGLIQEKVLLETYALSHADISSRIDPLKASFSFLSKDSMPKERTVLMKLVEVIDELCSFSKENIKPKILH